MVPLEASRVPLTNILPAILNDVVVVTEPLTEKLSSDIPDPLIVLDAPVINRVPPDAWLNEPDDMVDRFPDKDMSFAENATCDAATVRLLKFCIPIPLTREPLPKKVMVPVFPLKLPSFTQFPYML